MKRKTVSFSNTELNQSKEIVGQQTIHEWKEEKKENPTERI